MTRSGFVKKFPLQEKLSLFHGIIGAGNVTLAFGFYPAITVIRWPCSLNGLPSFPKAS